MPLSENMIDLLVCISDRLGNSVCNSLTSFTTHIFSLPLYPYEHLIAFAMVALARHEGQKRSGSVETIVNHALTGQVETLIRSEINPSLGVVKWALLTIRATIRFNEELNAWLDQMLGGMLVTGQIMSRLEGLFFEIPEDLGSSERGIDEI
jgi:hypothetical protein